MQPGVSLSLLGRTWIFFLFHNDQINKSYALAGALAMTKLSLPPSLLVPALDAVLMDQYLKRHRLQGTKLLLFKVHFLFPLGGN